MEPIEENYKVLVKEYYNYINELNAIRDHFAGPSIYFHKRSLEECKKDFLGDSHIEYIYATLASWGMHRMGKTSTKMKSFIDFKNSIIREKEKLIELQNIKIEKYQGDIEELIRNLKEICFSFQVSASNSKIVSNSKTLAHILPDLVPPIDRRYTVRFFVKKPNKLIKNNIGDFKDIEDEKKFFEYILEKTFDFVPIISKDKRIQIDKEFNTSYPKIFDNLIIAYIKKKEKSPINV